jgi:ectoine hydroxylase-related dioxygenase (phytanoyl-CoA dioxygenase family)
MNPDTTNVDDAWRLSFARDGAGVLRGVIPQPWIERMRAAIDGALRREGPLAVNLAPRTKGAFFNDLFLWRLNEDFRAFVFESPLPRLAADILAADEVRLFYDQLFVMEPRGETGTPWHQDLPYWPIRGPDVISIWVPFDAVSPENGVVSYVKGSHRWDKLIRPTSPRLAADGRADEMSTSGKGTDFDPADPGVEFLEWNLEPGDVLVHHAMTVHGAPANNTQDRRRRAIAVRFAGPQTRFDPRPGTWIHDTRVRAHLPFPDLQAGDPLRGELFPRVWPFEPVAAAS